MPTDTIPSRYVTVGVQDAPESLAAVRFGAVEAAARDCTLLLAHAYVGGEGSSPDTVAVDTMARAEQAENLLNAAAAQAREVVEVAVEMRLASLTPYQLLRRLESESALVVLGQQSRVIGSRPPLRSIGGRLAVDLRCAVAVVPRGWAPTQDNRPVVVAVADDPAWSGALRQALATAQRTGRELVIVHAVREGSSAGELHRHEAYWEALTAEWKDAYVDVKVRTIAAPADPSNLVVQASWEASQVFLGQPHHGSLSPAWFFSTARRVLEIGQCPVVLVPPGAEMPPVLQSLAAATINR